MDIFHPHTTTPLQPQAGRLLIAQPFLNDSNFARTVVLLCEHGENGSVGFILNKPTHFTVSDILENIFEPSPVLYNGGPVQTDTLHMIHDLENTLGGCHVVENVFLGGAYDVLQDMVANQDFHTEHIKLLIGYAGWSAGQLEKEIEEGAWIVAPASPSIIFQTQDNSIWKTAMRSLGEGYKFLANMPTDPQLN
jgi:putative transcriptional regulator